MTDKMMDHAMEIFVNLIILCFLMPTLGNLNLKFVSFAIVPPANIKPPHSSHTNINQVGMAQDIISSLT